MKKGSKPPEERRKELVDTAARLFAEKGYESVSVRDILNEVSGAPGMFYYYFKSKQDIYLATMEEYISENLERKCSLMEDKEMPFEERRRMKVKRQYYSPESDGFYGAFYACPSGSEKAMILMLGDAIDDRMAILLSDEL